jgi:phosphohistidine phosphatase
MEPSAHDVTLHLVRHADAVDAAAGTSDAERPLSRRGLAQARALAVEFGRLGLRVERLATSPRLRARETAQLAFPSGPPATVVEALAAGDPEATLATLRATGVGQVAAVGHEPFLSQLTAYLLTGRLDGVRVRVGKASVITLHGPLEAGRMTLVALRPRPAGT